MEEAVWWSSQHQCDQFWVTAKGPGKLVCCIGYSWAEGEPMEARRGAQFGQMYRSWKTLFRFSVVRRQDQVVVKVTG